MEASRSPLWRRLAENPQPWLLGACIAACTGLVGIELWSAARATLAPSAAPRVQNHTAPRDDHAAEQIASANLFGLAANQNANLPETSLQLTLRAVFAAQDPGQASAIIETSDGHAQIVRTGGTIAADTTLQEIHGNNVVLAHNGALETLYFPTLQESSDIAVAQNGALPDIGGDQDAGSQPPTGGGSPEEIKRAAILQRLEELRARSSR